MTAAMTKSSAGIKLLSGVGIVCMLVSCVGGAMPVDDGEDDKALELLDGISGPMMHAAGSSSKAAGRSRNYQVGYMLGVAYGTAGIMLFDWGPLDGDLLKGWTAGHADGYDEHIALMNKLSLFGK